MSSAERLVGMDDAQAGMVLSRDLLDAHGQVLMAKGVELAASALGALRRRDIEELWVQDEQAAASDATAAIDAQALRQQHQARLERLFRQLGDRAEDRFLRDVVRRYRGIAEP